MTAHTITTGPTDPTMETRRSSLPETTPTLLAIKDETRDTSNLVLRPFPTPTRQTVTQILVRVHATSFTRGELSWPEPNELAHPIPCRDFAGTILELPISGSARFERGDRVYALTSFSRPGHGRTISVVEESELAHMPEGISFEDAAAVPMGALTAWQALFVHAGFEAKQGSSRNASKKLMITGAAGAVGIWVVQLAVWAGVGRVVCVVRPGAGENAIAEFAKGDQRVQVLACERLGKNPFAADGEKLVDAVIDCAGGQRLEDAWTAVKSGGLVIGVAEPPEGKRPAEGVKENVRGVWFIVEPDGEMLEGITRDVLNKGKARWMIDSVVNFEEFETAWRRTEHDRKGKVVMKLAKIS